MRARSTKIGRSQPCVATSGDCKASSGCQNLAPCLTLTIIYMPADTFVHVVVRNMLRASTSAPRAQGQAADFSNAPAFDQPVVSVRDPASLAGAGGGIDGKAGALRGGAMPSSSESAGSPAPDGVVPEVPALKKQRV